MAPLDRCWEGQPVLTGLYLVSATRSYLRMMITPGAWLGCFQCPTTGVRRLSSAASRHLRDDPRHHPDRRSVSTVKEMSSVEVNGIELAYSVTGEVGLSPVVLLHALGEDSRG
jgi:hypothetical protein